MLCFEHKVKVLLLLLLSAVCFLVEGCFVAPRFEKLHVCVSTEGQRKGMDFGASMNQVGLFVVRTYSYSAFACLSYLWSKEVTTVYSAAPIKQVG